MKTSSPRGFTLVETVVVIALVSIIMAALGSLLVFFYKTNAYVYQQATATIQARRGVDDAIRYAREAEYGADGSYPIRNAATSTITLSADTNNDNVAETVTYRVANGSFSRTVVGAGTLTTTLSTSVVNGTSTPIFRYFDKAGAELSAPVDTAKIFAITATLVTRVDSGRGPSAFTLSGRAQLRNSRL